MTSGDLNGDNKSDLIVGAISENKIAVLLNNGQGGFLAPNAKFIYATKVRFIPVVLEAAALLTEFTSPDCRVDLCPLGSMINAM